jgi:hypothetical protein
MLGYSSGRGSEAGWHSVAQLSNLGNGKKQIFPAPGVSVTETGKWA